METAITANPNAMRMYTPTILTTLLPLLQSPLTAPVMMPVLLKLGKSAFNDDQEHLGGFILPVSLMQKGVIRSVTSLRPEKFSSLTRNQTLDPQIKRSDALPLTYSEHNGELSYY